MKHLHLISFTLILMLCSIGCKKVEKKEQKPIEKETAIIQREFGKRDKQNDSPGVELQTNRFNKWNDLVERAGNIACNDSIPKITLNTSDAIKTVYLQNPCSEDQSSMMIKSKNVIEIHNDSILKPQINTFPLDSLESILRKDIANNGKDPLLSESPKKLVISVFYDEEKDFKNLTKHLDRLTQEYYKITNQTDIKIWLTNKAFFQAPPRFKISQSG